MDSLLESAPATTSVEQLLEIASNLRNALSALSEEHKRVCLEYAMVLERYTDLKERSEGETLTKESTKSNGDALAMIDAVESLTQRLEETNRSRDEALMELQGERSIRVALQNRIMELQEDNAELTSHLKVALTTALGHSPTPRVESSTEAAKEPSATAFPTVMEMQRVLEAHAAPLHSGGEGSMTWNPAAWRDCSVVEQRAAELLSRSEWLRRRFHIGEDKEGQKRRGALLK